LVTREGGKDEFLKLLGGKRKKKKKRAGRVLQIIGLQKGEGEASRSLKSGKRGFMLMFEQRGRKRGKKALWRCLDLGKKECVELRA